MTTDRVRRLEKVAREVLEITTIDPLWMRVQAAASAALAPDPSEEAAQYHPTAIAVMLTEKIRKHLKNCLRTIKDVDCPDLLYIVDEWARKIAYEPPAPPPPSAPAAEPPRPNFSLPARPLCLCAEDDVCPVHPEPPTPSPASQPYVEDRIGACPRCGDNIVAGHECMPSPPPVSEVASPSGEEIARGCHHNLAHDCPAACPTCIDSALSSLRCDNENQERIIFCLKTDLEAERQRAEKAQTEVDRWSNYAADKDQALDRADKAEAEASSLRQERDQLKEEVMVLDDRAHGFDMEAQAARTALAEKERQLQEAQAELEQWRTRFGSLDS